MAKNIVSNFFSEPANKKKSRKYDSGLSCRWTLSRLELSDSGCILFYTELSSKTGFGGFRVFMITRLDIEPYFSLKPTKAGFIFIGPNS